MAFAYVDPSLPAAEAAAPRLRAAARLGLRVLGAGGLFAILLLPVLPAPGGPSGSAVAGIALAPLRVPGPGELQPQGPAAGFAVAPARPFVASYGDAASALRAETCLTEAIYYEGALEPEAGQRAIAQVVLNRVRHPAYPDNVCGVVFEGQERSTGCQFTFTCDGSRARAPVPHLWARANRVARAALGGAVAPEVGLATHYHADYVMPYWSATLDAAGQIGRHIFYRWRGANGQPDAFSKRYSGREPQIAAWVPRAPAPDGAGEAAAGALAVLTGGTAGSAAASPAGLALPGAATATTIAPALTPPPFRARPLALASPAARAGEAQ